MLLYPSELDEWTDPGEPKPWTAFTAPPRHTWAWRLGYVIGRVIVLLVAPQWPPPGDRRGPWLREGEDQ